MARHSSTYRRARRLVTVKGRGAARRAALREQRLAAALAALHYEAPAATPENSVQEPAIDLAEQRRQRKNEQARARRAAKKLEQLAA